MESFPPGNNARWFQAWSISAQIYGTAARHYSKGKFSLKTPRPKKTNQVYSLLFLLVIFLGCSSSSNGCNCPGRVSESDARLATFSELSTLTLVTVPCKLWPVPENILSNRASRSLCTSLPGVILVIVRWVKGTARCALCRRHALQGSNSKEQRHFCDCTSFLMQSMVLLKDFLKPAIDIWSILFYNSWKGACSLDSDATTTAMSGIWSQLMFAALTHGWWYDSGIGMWLRGWTRYREVTVWARESEPFSCPDIGTLTICLCTKWCPEIS